jgi:5-(carboxyamino)imidazole ribonucleotide synthase
MTAVLPGGTIGVLGSGQLGRMLALAARPLGYRVHVFSPEQNSPAGQVANLEVAAPYGDLTAVRQFAAQVDVVTLEFENVPVETAMAVAEIVPLRPGPGILHIAQNRQHEKRFLSQAGLPVTPYAPVKNVRDLAGALEKVGCPAILKTAASGYDGKGQIRINQPDQAPAAWEALNRVEAVLEAFLPFEREASVIVARGLDGRQAHYNVIENDHQNHILDVSRSPARLEPETAAEAIRLATAVAELFGLVGVLCVEFFVMGDGRLYINEVAPRPHNSGHLTIDACVTSQFEQQLRAVCGLPLGDTTQLRPAAMANLLGDLWQPREPDWLIPFSFPTVKLHLYGKLAPRLGRKMGHVTAVAETTEQAVAQVLSARAALQGSEE